MVSITGLEQAVADALTQNLEHLQLPLGFSGEIVFEFLLSKGRVGRIVVDEDASTLKEEAVIDIIKRALTTWIAPRSVKGTVRLVLAIQS